MNKIKVKYCGLRTKADVKHAIDAGVDAIGLVFVKKSPRYINLHEAIELSQIIKQAGIDVVALFADHSKEVVIEVIETISPDVLQFHGSETPDFCEQFNQRYWKAVPMLSIGDYESYIADYLNAEAFLLDAFGGQQSGGSGESFDWFKWPKALCEQLILAGGLNAHNVLDAIEATGTRYVDTSSGIESSPGVKSKTKMAALMHAINNK